MQTVVLVLVVVLSGFLVNKLSDRYEFPVPDWMLWAALIGLGLLYEVRDELPQQLAARLGRATPEQLGNWAFWDLLTVFTGSVVALMIRSRQRLPSGRESPSVTQPATAATHLRQQLLKAVSQYVSIRRRESLHNYQLINVQMQDLPDAMGKTVNPGLAPAPHTTPKAIDEQPGILKIRRFFSDNLTRLFGRQTGIDLGEPLAPETSIISVFNHEDIYQRLLILGEPGAGKTTYLLELAWDLVQQAEQNAAAPVPVIVDLASWQPGQTIPEWLTHPIAENLCDQSKPENSARLAKHRSIGLAAGWPG